MKIICINKLHLLGCFLFIEFAAFAQKEMEYGYAVTQAGDTVWLNNESYIQAANHPQTNDTKGNDRKKKIIPSTNIVLLYMDAGNAGCYNLKGMRKLTVVPIATKKGKKCHHFVYQLITQCGYSVYISPYRQRYSSLTLYYQQADGNTYSISKKNFAEVCGSYFRGNPEMVEFSKRKKYNACRLLKLLLSSRDYYEKNK